MIQKLIAPARNFFSHKPGVQKFIPAICWFFVLLILLMLPSRDLPESNDWFNKIFIDKWIHAALFGLLALLFIAPVMSSRNSSINTWLITWFIVIGISLWGLATEFMQDALVEGRSFDIFDWVADTIGAIIAVWFSKHFFLNKANLAERAGLAETN